MIRNLTAAAIRVFAIFLALRSLQIAIEFTGAIPELNLPRMVYSRVAIYAFVLVAGAALLWNTAARVAAMIVPHEGGDDAATVRIEDLERVVFSVLGMYVITDALPTLAYWAYFARLWETTASPSVGTNPTTKARLVRSLVELAIGVGLVIGSEGLLNVVRRLRTLRPSAGRGKT